MRVNFASIGVITPYGYPPDRYRDRLVPETVIATVMLAIFFIASSFTNHPDPDLRVKQVNLSIRQIGHRLLLQTGDSTSRVLPVTETKEGTFLLQLENEFAFSHDSLLRLSQDFLPKTQFASGYTVTVHDCMTASIVYGFQLNNTSPDLLPCSGRSEPSGCYTIEFAFPDFSENVGPEKADIDQLSEELKSVEVDEEAEPNLKEFKTTSSANNVEKLIEKPKSVNSNQEANPKLEELKASPSHYEIVQLIEEPKPVNVDQEANPKFQEVKTTPFDHALTNLFYCGMIGLGVTLLIARSRKILTPAPVQNLTVPVQNQLRPLPVPSDQELAAVGKFLFDEKGRRLLMGSQVISLTDKECKILELFNRNFGELIPRETLMQEVWINEGVITGRSLDVFVSKLRKKLSNDPELRITNVHGKGYKLEMHGVEIS